MTALSKSKSKTVKNIFSLIMVFASAFLQAYTIIAFVRPAGLLSSGFTGVAILIDKITSLYGYSFSTSLAMICLNIPVALICYKSISPRFTIFSCIQIVLASIMLKIFNFNPVFDDIFLNVIFGGFLYGLCVVLALKGNASTGGTDFIALYVSNKKNKSIWNYVFIFNTIILLIFGYMFGWIYAGYSIVFQFITTYTIETFHRRYERVTLQITTENPQPLIDQYVCDYKHGISCVNAKGGYSKKDMFLLHTVVSTYEVQDIVELLRSIDSSVIINVLKTENFYGGFYQAPIE